MGGLIKEEVVSIRVDNTSKKENQRIFLKMYPPIKNIAKVASGKFSDVNEWLFLVKAIRKTKTVNSKYFLLDWFTIKLESKLNF